MSENIILIPLNGKLKLSNTIAAARVDVSNAVFVANATITGLPSTVDSGSAGSGATFEVAITAGSMAATTVEADAAGSGYKPGDVITIAGNTTNFTGSIAITVLNADLLGDEAEAIIDLNAAGGYPLFVKPDGSSYTNFEIVQIQSDHSREWKIVIAGGTADNYELITRRINDVFIKALQQPNSSPILKDIAEGVTVDSVTLS
jgi:guanyl-specific ribonuclease Sa